MHYSVVCNILMNVWQLRYTDDPDVESPNQKDCSEEKHQQVEKLFAALQGRQNTPDTNSTDQAATSTEQTPTEEGLSREFILTCALSPAARERPDDLSLDRTDDWVKDIVLVDVSIIMKHFVFKHLRTD